MKQARLTGPGAGAEKYDMLTALSVAALAIGGQTQISLLRLMALVTARYNWAQDELSLGQREMARMWSVDERTAKREVKRLIETGLLRVTRPGVKGRVACYRLDLAMVRQLTRPHWERVGPDFDDRMDQRQTAASEPPQRVVQVDFAARQRLPEAGAGDSPWERARDRLAQADPARFAAWFAPLRFCGAEDGALILSAPSRFSAQYVATHLLAPLDAALRAEFGPGTRCEIRADG